MPIKSKRKEAQVSEDKRQSEQREEEEVSAAEMILRGKAEYLRLQREGRELGRPDYGSDDDEGIRL